MAAGHFQTLQTRLGKFAGWAPGSSGGLLSSRRARSVTVDDLDEYTKFLKRHHKPNYVKNCVRAAQGMFAWAARDVPGRTPSVILPANPVKDFRVPGAGRMPERCAERSEAAHFLRYFRRFVRARRRSERQRFGRVTILLERVLIRTGCRPGEACAMRWDQVRWDAGVTSAGHRFARVVLEEHKTAAKVEKPRVIYLTPALTRSLRRLHRSPRRHPVYVFTHFRGTKSTNDWPRSWGDPWKVIPLSKLVREVRRAAIAEAARVRAALEAGADVPAGDRWLADVKMQDEGANRLVNYQWRHTAISTLIMMGVDVATVAELTGTSPEMIRQHYGHLLDEHLALAAEKLATARRQAR